MTGEAFFDADGADGADGMDGVDDSYYGTGVTGNNTSNGTRSKVKDISVQKNKHKSQEKSNNHNTIISQLVGDLHCKDLVIDSYKEEIDDLKRKLTMVQLPLIEENNRLSAQICALKAENERLKTHSGVMQLPFLEACNSLQIELERTKQENKELHRQMKWMKSLADTNPFHNPNKRNGRIHKSPPSHHWTNVFERTSGNLKSSLFLREEQKFESLNTNSDDR